MIKQSVAAIMVAGLAVSAVGCGSADTPQASTARPAKATQAAPDGDPDRYCRLVNQLETRGQKAFAGLGRDAAPADYRRAERRFVQANSELLDSLEPAVPEQLRDDIRTFVTAMRQRGGLEQAGTVTQRDASQAERALLEYERGACSA